MNRTRVGVLRGGPSVEYDVSLKTGQAVLNNLSAKYEGIDIFIDKTGVWNKNGKTVKPEDVFRSIDVIFNALHGEYGEDGKIQQLMDQFGVKYTGSNALASALGMNKIMAKKILKDNGIKMPTYFEYRKGADVAKTAAQIFKSMLMPVIIKPADRGSSLGLTKAQTLKEIEDGLNKVFDISNIALVEEFINGREATCAVIDNFRGEKIYSLLPIEIVIDDKERVFDFEQKYSGGTKEICPGDFSKEDKQSIQEVSAKVHKLLGLRHYSRSDLIVTPKRGVYFLEVNTLPGLTEQSLLPKSLEAVGTTLSQFLDHVLELALHNK
ncbi:MAG: D-alanine--D-alanine ligase [bacterium]